MIVGVALFGMADHAHAWGSERESYPNSIKEVAATLGAPGSPGHAALVRSSLSAAEHQAGMTFEVALRMRNRAELQDRIANGELISPYEMDARYFPLQADYDRVVQWIRDQGFLVVRIDANRLAVFARGSVDATAVAFQASFARVRYRGVEYTSAVTAPSIPVELSPMVLGIHGLQPHLKPHRIVQPRPMFGGGGTSYSPSQILTAYGAGSVSQTGAGQTIAMLEQADPTLADLEQFWTDAGVTGASPSNVAFVSVGLGPDTSLAAGYTSEVTEACLDAEWSSGIAPGAKIRIYGVGSEDPGAFDEGYQQVYEDLTADPSIHVLSLSFGENEDDMDRDYFLIESQYMANLAAAGVTVFAAAGDGGSNPDPESGNYNPSAPLQVEYPASDPSVTGVGGTELSLTSSNTRESELGWSQGGGGLSTIYARPSWQDTANNLPYSYRQVPDVCATADPEEGAFIVQLEGQNPPSAVGGTSWATPVWAGFCALMNQARGSPVGFLNPRLYPLAGKSAFVDIVSGGNVAYPATAGYDMSTGLGVPNVANLIQLIGNASGPLAIVDQLGPQFVITGQTATFAVVTYPPAGDAAVPQNPGFQWQMQSGSSAWANLSDNSTVQGSRTPFLAFAGVTAAMQGDQFRCVVTDGSSSVTSTPASLTVAADGVTTLAGWPEASGSANGTGRSARFDFIGSLRLDGQGNIYAADGFNDEVRKITPAGVVTTAAGIAGSAGNTDGPISSALFNSPGGVALDPSGNIYVADSGNYTVREISTSGQVTTLAGSVGVQGSIDGTGTNAQFYDMEDIAADGLGNLYVADGESDTIRKVVIATRAVTTFAGSPSQSGNVDGTGSAALFDDPNGVATDPSGNVYVSDTGNNRIREITPGGAVTTIAGNQSNSPGSQDGPASTAQFNGPAGLGLDSQGDIFVTDTLNFTVREISAQGIVSTVAGQVGVTENVDGPLLSADFGFPVDLAVNSAGVIYVADGTNNTVRQIVQTPSIPTITIQPEGQTINQGSTVVLTGGATAATGYQWLFNGSPISDGSAGGGTDVVSGATGPQLVISATTSLSQGSYSLEAIGSSGAISTSSAANLQVTTSSTPGYVVSISSRAFVGTGDNVLIGGFYIVGNTSATVLVQAIGPALAASPYDVSGVLQHPSLAIHQSQNGQDVVLYTNTGWGSNPVLLSAAAAAYAEPVLTPGSADSELLLTLPPGGYTAEVSGADGGTGVALCAIYQLP